MGEAGGRLGLYIFILVLNLAFPVLGYTFTTFDTEYEDYDASLDVDSLMMAGITFVDAESHNVSYNGAWVYFDIQNRSTRFRFMENIRDPWWVILGDGIATQRQTPGALSRGAWDSVFRVSVKSFKSGKWLRSIKNSSLISEWNLEYNWSRYTLIDGTNIFITPHSGSNMTKAVYVDGTLNITVAETFKETTTFNFWQFIGWYSGIIIGGQAWGLPPIFGWVLKILSALSILSLILLTREVIFGS